MSVEKRARLKQWLESGEARLHPLTFPQRELWETSAIPVGDPANHICCLLHVRGVLTERESVTAVRRVVDRQEVLRLSFLPGKERPLQMVRQTGEVNLRFQELSPAQNQPEAIEEVAREIFQEPFDLVQGPLYRVVILRRRADENVIVCAIHHAVADGWTLGVLVKDLFGAYISVVSGAAEPLPPLPLTYTAWGAAERALWQPSELETRATFWRSTLAGTQPLWTAPTRPSDLCRWVTSIPPEIAAATRKIARNNGATLFSTLLTAFQIALSRWTGADDFVVGTPVANRPKQASHETMGYFAGVVPIRCRVDQNRSFTESLRTVHQTTVDSFANAMPFVELVSALGAHAEPGHHPVFQVRFALQNHPVPDVALPTLSAMLRMRSTGTARFDLGCEVTERNEALEVVWLFRAGMFSQSDLEDLDRLFETELASNCGSPQSRAVALTN
ncbi:MAG TPA: condensation domain-containing protein [Chthoniobacteraceae bacterium]|nr:condensation domain-containing protein [Chthoniobacteraceae bacterium]